MNYLKWYDVDSGILPAIGELVLGYDHRRGFNVICWRAIRQDNYAGNITGTHWVSHEFGDNIMITYWYPIKPNPAYPSQVVRSNSTI